MAYIHLIGQAIHAWPRDVSPRAPIGGGTPSLRVSRYAPRFCPPFSALGRSFCLPKFDLNCLPFYSDLVGSHFEAPPPPPLSACRRSFCPPKLTKSIILFRSFWVPFWTLSGAPLLIFTPLVYPDTSGKIWYQPQPNKGLAVTMGHFAWVIITG